LQIASREAVAAVPERSRGEQDVGPPNVLGQPVSRCQLEAPLELAPALLLRLAGAHRGQGLRGDLGVVEPLGQLDSPAGPGRRLLRPGRGRTRPRQVRVGHRQLAARRLCLQERDRRPSGPLGFCGPAGTPEDLREPAERVTLLEPLAELAAALERGLDRLHRGVVLVGHVTSVGTALQQLGPRRRRQPAAEPEGARVLGGRLTVGAKRRRAGGSRWREAQDRLDVAGGLGMVGQPGRVWPAARWIGERRQRPAMQVHPSVR
jgi:hypothetical protein